MTDRVKQYLAFHLDRSYRKTRAPITLPPESDDRVLRACRFLQFITAHETPRIDENDIFGFHCTLDLPQSAIQNRLENFVPDYAYFIERGFNAARAELVRRRDEAPAERRSYFQASIDSIDALTDLADRYMVLAKKRGVHELAEALSVVPRKGAVTYYHALLFMKILIYALRRNATNHVTLGRFDQYMYKWYEFSRKNGASLEELTELTELFFISLNMDTDLYFGVQQGDNGQSLVLGGCRADGSDAYNELSDVVLKASKELVLIDPKINLRVNKSTPLSRYQKATELTAKGLGFPQYCNDDVVIPGLCALGYDEADARDYAVAACWEFIVPNMGYEIPNIATMNFPLVVRNATLSHLASSPDFEAFFTHITEGVTAEFERLREECDRHYSETAADTINPFTSLFVRPCREQGLDISENGAKYRNFGIHGLGIAPATDAIAAIQKYVFEERSVTPGRLIAALETNFSEDEALHKMLLAAPKLGQNTPCTNELSERLMAHFSHTVNGRSNCIGGIWRAGTGGPHDYIYQSEGVGATADGRRAGEPYPASFSPSIGVKASNLLSVICSFTHFDMTKIINGGPLTVELHSNVFRNAEGIGKVAQLVKAFVGLGGHQLQLNSINREKLIDAQAHPEKYPDLVVRVWGWSGYFRELDLPFQNHIISRAAFGV